MKRIALVLFLALLTLSQSAAADHGHNCQWTGSGWAGQGLCPGMPGFEWHGPEPTTTPTAEPSPTTTQAPTSPPATPSPTSTVPPPTSTEEPEPTPTSTATRPSRPTAEDVEKVRDQVLERFRQRQATQSPTTPAPVVTGPVIDTDIPFEHRNLPRGW